MRIMKPKKDKRFDGIRENFFKFAKFWLLQAVVIFIIMLLSILGLSKDGISPGAFSYMGLGIWAIGIVIEGAADWQKVYF